jgi:predicted nucleic acid-binding protein
MIVVSDTSPITNLAAVNQLTLLHQLYGTIIIPQAVYDEMASLGYALRGYAVPGTIEIMTLSWIETRPVTQQNQVNQLLNKLDRGESEGIILALELGADILILDERKGRKVAQSLGLNITGILGVLLEAKQKELGSSVCLMQWTGL